MCLRKIFVLSFILLQLTEGRYIIKNDILYERQDEELNFPLQSTESRDNDGKDILEERHGEELNLPLQSTERRFDFDKDILEQIISNYLIEPVRTGYFATPWGRRQVHKEETTNPDGSKNINVKVVLAKTVHNTISLIGSISHSANETGYNVASSGVMLENDKGISLNFTGIRIPNVGNQIMAAAKVNIYKDKHNKIDGTAFISRTKSNNSSVPNHTTGGGSLDFTLGNKVVGSLGISHSPELHHTDITSKGNANLSLNHTTVDFGGGMTMSISSKKPIEKPTPV